MEQRTFRHGTRLMAIVYPNSREEWEEAMRKGHMVATTVEQRRAWKLALHDYLPPLSREEILGLMALHPDDTTHDRYDPEMRVEPEELSQEEIQRLEELYPDDPLGPGLTEKSVVGVTKAVPVAPKPKRRTFVAKEIAKAFAALPEGD